MMFKAGVDPFEEGGGGGGGMTVHFQKELIQ